MTMDEEARLTTDEREEIDRAIHAGPQWGIHLVATIERIVTERVAQAKAEALAPVLALADEWEHDGFQMEADRLRDASTIRPAATPSEDPR